MFAASWALLAVGLLWPRRRNVNHCYLAGLGNGSHGKPPAARDALATRSGSSYVDFVGRWWRWQRGLRNEFVGH